MRLEDAFLSDILLHPDDDAPRLVFADFLADNGDEARADFIRAQCELARLPEEDARRPVLEWRAAELLSRHQQRWLAPVADCGVSWPIFRRGFLEAVDASAGAFLDAADRLFARAPVRELTLDDVDAHLDELARRPWLARLTALRLVARQTIDAGPVELPLRPFGSLCGSQHLGGLRVMDLAGCEIGTMRAGILMRSLSLPALAELGLTGNALTDAAIVVLSGCEQRGALEVLDLRGNNLTDGAARLLAGSPHLGRLRWLRLEGNPIGNEGVEALLGSSTLTRLTHLTCDEVHLRSDLRERLRQRRERLMNPGCGQD